MLELLGGDGELGCTLLIGIDDEADARLDLGDDFSLREFHDFAVAIRVPVRRLFVEELTGTLQTIARDTKVQVEFNPARVKRYRQMGYENRQLKKEDFRNDAVDAGEHTLMVRRAFAEVQMKQRRVYLSIIAAVAVLLVLIILDIVGVTNIFSFINSAR